MICVLFEQDSPFRRIGPGSRVSYNLPRNMDLSRLWEATLAETRYLKHS